MDVPLLVAVAKDVLKLVVVFLLVPNVVLNVVLNDVNVLLLVD